jgi:hypothetical protein
MCCAVAHPNLNPNPSRQAAAQRQWFRLLRVRYGQSVAPIGHRARRGTPAMPVLISREAQTLVAYTTPIRVVTRVARSTQGYLAGVRVGLFHTCASVPIHVPIPQPPPAPASVADSLSAALSTQLSHLAASVMSTPQHCAAVERARERLEVRCPNRMGSVHGVFKVIKRFPRQGSTTRPFFGCTACYVTTAAHPAHSFCTCP